MVLHQILLLPRLNPGETIHSFRLGSIINTICRTGVDCIICLILSELTAELLIGAKAVALLSWHYGSNDNSIDTRTASTFRLDLLFWTELLVRAT